MLLVYIETNFLLEIALLQDQHEGATQVVDLAEAGKITLALPAFCLIEAYQALENYRRQRNELATMLSKSLREINRMAPYAETAREAFRVADLLVKSTDESEYRLAQLLERLRPLAICIPQDESVAAAALGYRQRFELKLPDAVVLASVALHAKQTAAERKIFLNRNSRDFASEAIQTELHVVACELLASFNGVPQRLSL